MITLLHGDCRDQLQTLPDRSVQTVITSPPYYGLRVYNPGDPREIGQEPTPAAYVAALVAVFAECWRVLRDDGTLFLNLGDSYSAGKSGRTDHGTNDPTSRLGPLRNGIPNGTPPGPVVPRKPPDGMQSKQLLGIPWRVAFALQDAGWILRSDIIWSKPNPMPESVRDRPTRAHEYVFMFAKRQRYYYDATAISEPVARLWDPEKIGGSLCGTDGRDKALINGHGRAERAKTAPRPDGTRNRRSVWTIATRPYAAAHFATFPEALVEPCILAGSAAQACETCGAAWVRVVERESASADNPRDWQGVPEYQVNRNGRSQEPKKIGAVGTPKAHDRGFAPACRCETNTGRARSIVLDPFGGAGTVSKVAERFQRDSILIDLNPAYVELQEDRTNGVQVDMLL